MNHLRNIPEKAKKQGANRPVPVSTQADASPLRVESGLFESEEQYEQVAQSVAARIRSGEIPPCEPDTES